MSIRDSKNKAVVAAAMAGSLGASSLGLAGCANDPNQPVTQPSISNTRQATAFPNIVPQGEGTWKNPINMVDRNDEKPSELAELVRLCDALIDPRIQEVGIPYDVTNATREQVNPYEYRPIDNGSIDPQDAKKRLIDYLAAIASDLSPVEQKRLFAEYLAHYCKGDSQDKYAINDSGTLTYVYKQDNQRLEALRASLPYIFACLPVSDTVMQWRAGEEKTPRITQKDTLLNYIGFSRSEIHGIQIDAAALKHEIVGTLKESPSLAKYARKIESSNYWR